MAEGISSSTIGEGVKNVGPEHTESVNKLVDGGILPESMRAVKPESLWEKLWNEQKPESPDFLKNVYDPSKILEEIELLHASDIKPGFYSIYIESGDMTLVPITSDPHLKDCPLGDGSIRELQKYAPLSCYGIARVGTNPQKVAVELFSNVPKLPELKKYAG